MTTWTLDAQERFLALVEDFWPSLARGPEGRRQETLRLWLNILQRYPLEIVLAVLRERKEGESTGIPPTLSAIQAAIHERMRAFRRRETKDSIPIVSPQELTANDPDGWWAEREAGPDGRFYVTARSALWEGCRPSAIVRLEQLEERKERTA